MTFRFGSVQEFCAQKWQQQQQQEDIFSIAQNKITSTRYSLARIIVSCTLYQNAAVKNRRGVECKRTTQYINNHTLRPSSAENKATKMLLCSFARTHTGIHSLTPINMFAPFHSRIHAKHKHQSPLPLSLLTMLILLLLLLLLLLSKISTVCLGGFFCGRSHSLENLLLSYSAAF